MSPSSDWKMLPNIADHSTSCHSRGHPTTLAQRNTADLDPTARLYEALLL